MIKKNNEDNGVKPQQRPSPYETYVTMLLFVDAYVFFLNLF